MPGGQAGLGLEKGAKRVTAAGAWGWGGAGETWPAPPVSSCRSDFPMPNYPECIGLTGGAVALGPTCPRRLAQLLGSIRWPR